MSNTAPLPPLKLALSGGGVRATAFHLGVLQRLADGGQFENIQALSTVSGGALAIGLVFSHNNGEWPKSEAFKSAVLPGIVDTLTTASLQASFIVRTLIRPHRWVCHRAAVLAGAMKSVWGIKGNITDLPVTPKWEINCTCYETGKNWRFSREFMGDWVFGRHYKPDLPLADVLAASAGVPFLIGMLSFRVPQEGWYKINPADNSPVAPIQPKSKRVRLWDGGVYDNLGIEALHKVGRSDNDDGSLLLVSDASARLGFSQGGATPISWWKGGFDMSFRLIDITTDQIRGLRSRFFVGDLKNQATRGCLIKMGNTTDHILNGGTSNTTFRKGDLDKKTVEKLATMGTHLEKLAESTCQSLIQHGYETADATLDRYLPEYFGTT